jgi:ABC-2 type transport system permease protein
MNKMEPLTNKTFVVMRKELLDVRRNKFLLVLLAFTLFTVLVSIVVSALGFRVKLDAYNNYAKALHLSGNFVTPAPPQLFPLQLLRGSIEYLEILGALFAIVMGYGVIAKEKQKATIGLIFTRPVGRHQVANGKVLALAWIWFLAVTMIFAVVGGVVALVSHAPLHAIDFYRLILSAVVSWIYLVLWSALAMGLASVTQELSVGLIISIVLWLCVVLILPQIGDTMDPDNQVPGGLFNSLQISRTHQQAVLANFAGFDKVRNGIEVSSITKHYERSTFAYLGIKDKFNQKPLGFALAGTLPNLISLIVASLSVLLFAILTTTRKKLLRRKL